MSNRLKFIGMAVAAIALASSPALSATDTVVAIVNGTNILKKDVEQAIAKLPVKEDVPVEKVYPFVIEHIINDKLITDEAAKAKIEETAEYKKNLDLFKAEMTKRLYIENSLKDKIGDKAVKAEYEQFKKENKGKQELRARHILVPTEEEAKQVIKDLEAGGKFAELAAKRSSDTSNAQMGGDLGYFLKDDMVKEFSDAAFEIKPGSYGKTPVKTPFGWHVIMVEDKRERKVPEMKEIEIQIKNKLGQDALQKLVGELRSKAEIKVFNLDGTPMGETKKN